jgi:hypothetical protein
MKFSEFQPINEAPQVPAKPGPAQPAAKASAATAKMAPKPPVPAKPGANPTNMPAGMVAGSQADLDSRMDAYLRDVEAIDMPNAFTKQIKSRDAKMIHFDTPASREIKAKINLGTGASTAGLSPKQAAKLKRQSLAARDEMNARTPATDAEIDALEKYAK